MKTKTTLLKATLVSILFGAASLSAAELQVTVTNITSGLHFTPILISAHSLNNKLFESGRPASEFPGLEEMAERGATADLSSRVTNAGAVVAKDPGNDFLAPGPGFLAPGASTTANLTTDTGQDYLSLVAMILPSNDGFVGVDSFKIPKISGTYRIRLNVWDSGTEANSEKAADMPNPEFLTSGTFALGKEGTGVTGVATADPNTDVHIHRGNVGDFAPTGGISDMNASVHRWLNPAAAVTIVVR